jgi:prevent-host-death family protein
MRTELVTTLKRKATEIISDLATQKDPILITQHGLPAAYLVDVAGFEALQNRIEILEGIALGEEAVRAGKVLSQAQAKRKMSRWLK